MVDRDHLINQKDFFHSYNYFSKNLCGLYIFDDSVSDKAK